MSREIGLDTVALRPTPRLAHTEYSMGYHEGYLAKLSRPLHEAWDFDFEWVSDDGPVDWTKQGRFTDMGHAVYAADGSDLHAAAVCPFTDPEEVYDFDPVREYGLPSHRELVKYYRDNHAQRRAKIDYAVVPGGYYRTVISGALQAFGWDMLLLAAADEVRFAKVLERIGAYTEHYVRAQAETDIDCFIQHDDMVWTAGPFMSPAFYRGVIFPIFKRLWKILHKAGKKVIFCSDGTYDMFMEDLAACGADGFIFEPTNYLDDVVERFGRTHVIVGSKVDCRTMALGTWEQVKAEIDATLRLAKRCPGFIWAVGNHIPANVSDEMLDRYIAYLRANWGR
jgi:hypothetical protein